MSPLSHQSLQELTFNTPVSDSLAQPGKSPSFEQAKIPAAIIPEQLAVECLEQPDPKFSQKFDMVSHFALLYFQGIFQHTEQLFDQRSLKPSPPQRLRLGVQVG